MASANCRLSAIVGALARTRPRSNSRRLSKSANWHFSCIPLKKSIWPSKSELLELDRSVAASSFQIVSIPKRSHSIGRLIDPDQSFSGFDMCEPRARAKGSNSL